jgi:hypothetical protein
MTGVAKNMVEKIVDFNIQEKTLDTAHKNIEEDLNQKYKETFNNCFQCRYACLSDGKVPQRVKTQYNNRQKKILDSE